jgi:hypothetical protein
MKTQRKQFSQNLASKALWGISSVKRVKCETSQTVGWKDHGSLVFLNLDYFAASGIDVNLTIVV